jgi:hypothetical protein
MVKFEQIPEKIIEVISSKETSSLISDICTKNNITDEEKIEGIAYQIGLTLSGSLPSDLLASSFTKILDIEDDLANKIAKEIENSLFFQIKNELSEIYGNEPTIKIDPRKDPEIQTEELLNQKEEMSFQKENPIKSINKDDYREKLE